PQAPPARAQAGGAGKVRWYRRDQGQPTAGPLPSHQPARAAVATRTRVYDSRASQSRHDPWRADAGRPAGKEMTVTRNKARKTAARQRMAQTGEPYSVARRAAGTPGEAAPDAAGTGTAPEDAASGTPAAQQGAGEITPEERYAREAEAAGVPAAEIEARLAGFRAQEAADWAQRSAEQARELAERAEEAADRAEERADLAQEAAELAH